MNEILKRLIAVDTEYQSTESASAESSLERETGIHKVWCVAFSRPDAEALTIWTGDKESYPDILADAAKHFGIERPIFINFFYQAEWEAFARLGCDITAYDWMDVHLLYRLATNVFAEGCERSLVAMCADVLGVSIDSAHKQEMRQLCIDGTVDGYESTIMGYCAEDTAHLIPAFEKLYGRLEKRYQSPLTMIINPARRKDRSVPLWELLAELMASLACFTKIAHRGLPVDGDRLRAVRAGARVVKHRMIEAFAEKYPGAYRLETPSTKTLDHALAKDAELQALAAREEFEELFGAFADRGYSPRTLDTLQKQAAEKFGSKVAGIGGTWKRSDKVCRKYLLLELKKSGIVDDYPKTDKGCLSLSKDALDDAFGKQTGSFGGDLRELLSRLTSYNGILAEGKTDWLATFDDVDSLMRYRSLEPFGTVTGRCAPKPARGWIFGWDKSLYCVFNPPAGKWMVELDFGSEETFVQAETFMDAAYKELYYSKDIYLHVGYLTGIIPEGDYKTMTKAELKAKYKKQRDILKTFTLAIGYGAGDRTLAAKTKLPLETVEAFRAKWDGAFAKTTRVREYIADRLDSRATQCMWLANGWHAVVKRHLLNTLNSPLNFPIQGTGAVILHTLVRRLEAAQIETIATVHDAIVFLVDEGDYATIEEVRGLMKSTADEILGVKEGEVGMKVGDAEILAHGCLWTPEHEFDAAAKEILTAGGYDLAARL